MPFSPFVPAVQEAPVPAVITPAPLFGTEFRCLYLHSDGEICGHKCQAHWFCAAHVNTPIKGDIIYMGGDRLVPKAKGTFNRAMPTPEQMMAHVYWVRDVKAAQVAQMTALVNDAARNLQGQVDQLAALQQQVANRKPGRRALNALRKVLS